MIVHFKNFMMLAAATCISAVAVPAAAAGLPYSGLVVFGDSLVDAGNARIGSLANGLPDPAPPSAGYFQGRFSNGYTYADDLNIAITGAPSTASLAGGRNFAFGGADAAYHPTERSPSFPAQLSQFASSGQTIASDALVLITFGGNDVRDVLLNTGTVDFTPTLDALSGGIEALWQAGARNIVVTGLPDIGALPRTRADAAAAGDPNIITVATERSEDLNAAFDTLVDQEAAATGANIQFFDLLGVERALLANPTAFGLPANLNSTSYCQAGGPAAVIGGCEGYLYFDQIHPTARVHTAIANSIIAQISAVPEPASWAMIIVGFGLTGSALRRASPRRAVA